LRFNLDSAFADNEFIAIFVRSTVVTVYARMAESVDALVSNTNGAIRAGSIPAPGTFLKPQIIGSQLFGVFILGKIWALFI
jgi:hypothetical protein